MFVFGVVMEPYRERWNLRRERRCWGTDKKCCLCTVEENGLCLIVVWWVAV